MAARTVGDWQRVISEIDMAESPFYQLDPVGIPLAWYRGIGKYSLNNFQEAHEDFRRASQVHPYQIHVLNNMGTSFVNLGDYESAVRCYKRALDIWPRFEDARINLGVIYYHMGHYAEARRHLMRLSRNHEDTRVSVYLQFIENRLKKTVQ